MLSIGLNFLLNLMCSISKTSMYQLLQPQLDIILFEIVFPLMCFNDNDQKLWSEDPHEYVRKGYGSYRLVCNTDGEKKHLPAWGEGMRRHSAGEQGIVANDFIETYWSLFHYNNLVLLQIADALYYNPSLTLGILHKLGVATEVFNLWFQMLQEVKKSGMRAHFKRCRLFFFSMSCLVL
ncbi:hypothetical protein BHM03_00036003 [Ensete ventricosum]|nr:hypothetical protein BHM03_00036003 [Ensete ventricosum]